MSRSALLDPITFWNNRRVWTLTLLLAAYAVLAVMAALRVTPPFIFTNPVAQAILILGAVSGLAGAHRFGLLRNYVGSLMLYFSVSILANEISWIAFLIAARDGVPVRLQLATVGIGFFSGLAIAAFGLAKAARTVMVRFDRFVATALALSLAVSVGYSTINTTLNTALAQAWTPAEFFIWRILLPGLFFGVLFPSLTVLQRLGQWYVGEPLRLIVAGYVIFALVVPVVVILGQVVSLPPDLFFVVIGVANMVGLYTVSVGLTVMRPARSVQRLYHA